MKPYNRINVTLDDKTLEVLKDKASRMKKSIAAVIREFVEIGIERDEDIYFSGLVDKLPEDQSKYNDEDRFWGEVLQQCHTK